MITPYNDITMLNLTKEEKIVIVFVLSCFVIGSGISFVKKKYGYVPSSQLLAGIESVSNPSQKNIQVNINTADINGLIKIKGVGVKTAERIIEYRQVYGSFFSGEDLMRIKGIGPKKYEGIKDSVTIE